MHFRESHVCSTKLDVQETDIEAEIFSLDAGLRMDGIPALILWDLVIEVFHSVPNRTDGPEREPWRTPSAVVSTPTSFQQTLITFHSTQCIPVLVPCCMSLRTRGGHLNDYQR